MKKANFIFAILLLIVLVVCNGCTGAGNKDGAKDTQESASETQDSATQQDTATQAPETDGGGTATLIEPEQLISQEEAETILGVAVEVKKSEQAAVGEKLCLYSEAGNDAGLFLQISITQQAFMPEGSPSTPESIYNTNKEAFGGDEAVAEGAGDETILITGGYWILCDGYLIKVSAGDIDDPKTIMLLDVASETAVDNLKVLIGADD